MRVSHARRGRQAATLIELLIVIAILTVLMALLLPAIQRSRESARRAHCMGNIKVLGQGCMQHVQAHGSFPSGGWGYLWTGDPDRGFGRQQPGGWAYSILPYVEYKHLWAMGADGTTGWPTGSWDGTLTSASSATVKQNQQSVRLKMPAHVFYCASRRQPVALPAAGTVHVPKNCPMPSVFAKTDYATNSGDDNFSYASGPATDCLNKFPDCSWLDSTNPAYDHSSGVMYNRSQLPPAQIRDGLSNTILLAEKALAPSRYLTGDDTADNGDFAQGLDWDTTRTTSLAPARDNEKIAGGSYNYFGGPHIYTFPVAACDGSIRLISFEIDATTWSAIGTRNGGELVNWGD